MSIAGHSSDADPFRLVSHDLNEMTQSIRETVSVLQHPALDRAASHLLSLHGKRVRPIIVLLMAHATALSSQPASSSSSAPSVVASRGISSSPSVSFPDVSLLPAQLRLAEITELIHAASLLHDDVIDVADTRRGALSVNSLFGNQLAVLAGDFLLARASVALARLRDCDVVELLSTVIEHLVRGEVLQMRGSGYDGYLKENIDDFGNGSDTLRGGIGDATLHERRDDWFHSTDGPFESYLAKTFFKSASLVANSCRAVVMLAHHPPHVANAAYAFGEGIGIAFQLIDDVLDLTSSVCTLGKPVLNDMRQGVVTAPVLFAADVFPELRPIIDRRFAHDGDVDLVVDRVHRADGVKKTRLLAKQHAGRAVAAIVDVLPPSDYRSALINLAEFTLTRRT